MLRALADRGSSGRGDQGSGTLVRQSSWPSRFRAEPGVPAVVGFPPVALAHFKGGGGDFGELRGRSLKGRVRPWLSQLADCESQGVLRASIDLYLVCRFVAYSKESAPGTFPHIHTPTQRLAPQKTWLKTGTC